MISRKKYWRKEYTFTYWCYIIEKKILSNANKILEDTDKILADTDNYLVVLATTEVIVSALPRY